MSCSATTPDKTKELGISTSPSGTGTVSTSLSNGSRSTPATSAPTAAASTTVTGNGVDSGIQTTGDAHSSSYNTEEDKSTPARGEGGGTNALSLSYFAFLLTVVGAFVMKVIEV